MAVTVTALSVAAVKGTRIRAVDSVELDDRGARGDRAFYVVDAAGALVNGKRLGLLQTVVADYDVVAGTLALRFADGDHVAAQVRFGPVIPTTFFSRPRDARVLEGPWAQALSDHAGSALRIVEADIGCDRGETGTTSLISRGSLARLAQADTGGSGSGSDGGEMAAARAERVVDARRFRMLIEIDGVRPHAEDRWVGREVTVGDAWLRFHGHVGRCVTTTRGPESGEVDLPTLQMLASYRRDEPSTEPLAFGIHGAVLRGGAVRVGDPVAPVGE